MLLPQHNAHLVAVKSPGTPADFGTAAGAPVEKWVGDAQAFVREKTFEQLQGGELDVVSETQVSVPSNLPVQIVQDDLVTVILMRDNTAHTRRVRQIEQRHHVGIVRLRLWSDDV